MELYREIIKELPKRRRKITIYVHPSIAELLYKENEYVIEELEKQFKKKIVIKVSTSLHQEQYEVV